LALSRWKRQAEGREAWIIVVAHFVALCFVLGSGFDTISIFVPALVKQFGWSRAQVALMNTGATLTVALVTPMAGWLLDKVEARLIVSISAAAATVGLLLASQANGFGQMFVASIMLGAGVGGGTYVPAAVVICNWFDVDRGKALGVAMAGEPVGATIMTLVAGYVIATRGWRSAYMLLSVLILAAVIPSALAIIRTRPSRDRLTTDLNVAHSSHGMDVNEALRNRTFALIVLAEFCCAISIYAVYFHLAVYLTGIGYTTTSAAVILSAILALGALGQPLIGAFADRSSARVTLSTALIIAAAALVIAQKVQETVYLIVFVLSYGLICTAPNTLFPAVLVESVGLKSYGSLSGILQCFFWLGIALGGVLAGYIFDRTGSYIRSFQVCVALNLLSAGAIWLTSPLIEHKAVRAESHA
jgi:predicted MFS family arabinose efflux permease